MLRCAKLSQTYPKVEQTVDSHLSRLSMVNNIITAKMIPLEIVNMAISSLIMSVPVLSVCPS